MSTAALAASSAKPAPLCLPPRPPRPPRQRLPPGTVDCHCHVFEDPVRYPLVDGRSYTPAEASQADYAAACSALGITRCVQVSASVYGSDNRLTLDAIQAFGAKHARGVAGLAPGVDAAELQRLHTGGMRGVRLSTHVQGYGGIALLNELGRRIAPLGWHVQLHVNRIAEFEDILPQLRTAPCPVVFDHLGCARGDEGVDAPGFRVLLQLLREREDCWVKVSSWYRRSTSGPPGYADMRPLVRALLETRGDRVVFGSNWPHPNLFQADEVPDDAQLVDLLYDWVPEPALRQAMFVDNAVRLYGFTA